MTAPVIPVPESQPISLAAGYFLEERDSGTLLRSGRNHVHYCGAEISCFTIPQVK
jgi:hypothetical protein